MKNKKKMKTSLIIIISILFLVYISPFFSLYKIGVSIQNQDKATLNNYMDWPSLQKSLRDDVKAFLKNRENLRKKDLDNPIEGLEFNWTVNGEDMTSEIRDAGNVFRPSHVGDIQLEGMAAGRAARVDFLVLAGLPQSLSISHDLVSNSFPGGSEVILTVLGGDLAGK